MSGASVDERVQILTAEVLGMREDVSRIMDHLGISRAPAINTVPGQQYNMKTQPCHTAKQQGPATASGKHPQDAEASSRRTTEADDALRAPGHTHGEAMSLKNRAGGKPEKVKQFAEPQRKKACATAKTTNEQPPELASDAFPAALGSLPPELWEIFLMNSTGAADRTILLRMTSKRVKELVDKVRPPAVVCWRRSFLEEELNGTAAEKLQLVFRQLAELSARCRITTLELAGHHYEPTGSGRLKQSTDHPCKITGRYAERLAGVLAECPALAHLNLSCNIISISFAFLPRIALSFAFLPRLRSLDLSNNQLGAAGAECLAGVLGQCTALAHLDLSGNIIRAGAESLAGVLGQCAALAHLNLSYNGIEAAGAERLAGALAQCPPTA